MRFTLAHADTIITARAHLETQTDNFAEKAVCFQKILDFLEEAFPQQGNPTEWPIGSAVLACNYLRALELPVPELVNDLREPVEKLRSLFNNILTDYSFNNSPSKDEVRMASESLDVLFELVIVRRQRGIRKLSA